ncbi:MAG: hypothetical protein A2939_05495 [Parcubacteria group bacterium RIFCSPLOWO2_01_FULL_48_18]|nr:MAG: hypothetical protein A3J67_06475 [Parcubacteria group bacterium RIFCSPHIGHO2_02_FULL_48_10b]OHB22552.1 MAG: hypothetical protein A2939_05495 [Parcubacteria group bacterium RIFCSPLOWO2_01_FULL_48_18]
MPNRILIIEDEAEDMLMLKTKFSLSDFEVIEARDAKNGLLAARDGKPDIILLDLVLGSDKPFMESTSLKDSHNLEFSGIRLLRKLKSDPETAHIPIAVISNLGRDAYEAQTKKLGALDYLVKSELLPEEIVERAGKLIHK